MVHESRGQAAARELLGDFSGTLVTDRWGGYGMYEGPRQLCWAHLCRDFKAVSESGGWLGKTGAKLCDLAGRILGQYKRVRDGTLKIETFRKRIATWKPRLAGLLKRGASHAGALSAKCREIWKCRGWLWTFVEQDRVEPTNNLAERDVRQGVLWRKGNFGVQSERGATYVERVLCIGATCRRQGKSIIDFFSGGMPCVSHSIPRTNPNRLNADVFFSYYLLQLQGIHRYAGGGVDVNSRKNYTSTSPNSLQWKNLFQGSRQRY